MEIKIKFHTRLISYHKETQPSLSLHVRQGTTRKNVSLVQFNSEWKGFKEQSCFTEVR